MDGLDWMDRYFFCCCSGISACRAVDFEKTGSLTRWWWRHSLSLFRFLLPGRRSARHSVPSLVKLLKCTDFTMNA